jgi:hypothetical protein
MYKKFREQKEFVSGTYGWYKFQDKIAESIVRKDFLQYWVAIGLGVLLIGLFFNRDVSDDNFLVIWVLVALLGVATIFWYARWYSFLIVSSTGVLGPSAGSYRRSRILWSRLGSVNIRVEEYGCLFDSDMSIENGAEISFDNLPNLKNIDMASLHDFGEEEILDYLFDSTFLVLYSTSFEEISIFLPPICDEKTMIIDKIFRGLAWYRTEYVS